MLANPAYIPTCRWRKERVESCNSYCCVKTCNNLSFSQTTTYSSMINCQVYMKTLAEKIHKSTVITFEKKSIFVGSRSDVCQIEVK